VVFLRILYTRSYVHYPTQYSHFISLLNRHLYADDTQLFLSFCPSNLNFKITHLQNALHILLDVCQPFYSIRLKN